MRPIIRTRFPPSPTGDPHVGNIRTALFAWLFARHNGGIFVLRIEDTDVARKVEGSVEVIFESLRWLGLDWDEGPEVGGDYGPYYQSQRLGLYQEAARRLVEQGDAYYCYCSPERLEELRAEQVRRKQPPGYDRRCRELSDEERKKKENEGITPVVRLKTPLNGQTGFHDIIWGDVTFSNMTLEDLVLLKSDGYPTYHLANVVDDHTMEITHVLRAEEWISSTPYHILLYGAMGYQPPQFAHLPMLLGHDRSKLGKRHGSVSITEFREQGYLPEAMVNFLALLGWSLDDKTEMMTRQELISNFTLERVSKTAAIFNQEKLDWMNGVYIRNLDPEDFLQRSLPFLEKNLPPDVPRPLSVDYVRQITPLVQERVKTLAGISALTRFFFTDRLEYETDSLITKDMTAESTHHALEVTRQRLVGLPAFDAESLEEMLRPLAVELELKTGQLFGALRTAVTGQAIAPPLFQTMAVLGKDTCLERIDLALERL
jgi:glutamyl-tRNA synthetase